MPQKYTKEQFIEKAQSIHGNKYDYSKVDYKNNHTKICIICPVHGEFWQAPNSHLSGSGCPYCSVKYRTEKRRKTTEQFIEEAGIIHGDKYDYSKVAYCQKDKKVCIICKKHGEFWQTPHNHLLGCGCPKCRYEKNTMLKKDTTESFIKKAKMIHGDKYDYSKVNYIDSHTPVCIICKKHGEFWQRPNNHIHGWGCSKCSGVYQKTTEEFIKEATAIYGDKYDYTNTIYIKSKLPIIVTCKEHGDFNVYPNDHLHGQECPKCSMFNLEKEIKCLLDENSIEYIWQYSNEFLGRQKIDFYLPKYNCAIECQGEQHFKPIKFFGGEKKFSTQKAWDKRKQIICKEKGISLLYYTSKKIYTTEKSKCHKNTFFNKEELLKEIKARKN